MNSKEEIAKNTEAEKIRAIRPFNYTKYYVTNIKGGLTTQDFRYELMNEKVLDGDSNEWVYVSDALLILSPTAAKRFYDSLKKDIDFYEREHGVIPTEFEEEKIY